GQGGSFTWFARQGDAQRTPEEFERVTALLRTFIDEAVPRYGGDPARGVVLRFSQGGTLAHRLGLGDPGRFPGLAAPPPHPPEEGVEHAAPNDEVAKLPVLVQHGTNDAQIAVERAQQSHALLLALGVQPDYREYPMGHQIGGDSMSDLSDWLERVL